jgi:hypothetical protein
MKKEATLKRKGLKTKTSDEKKRQLQNAWGSKHRAPMKKDATPTCKGHKTKSSDKKRGNPKTQGAQKKDLR